MAAELTTTAASHEISKRLTAKTLFNQGERRIYYNCETSGHISRDCLIKAQKSDTAPNPLTCDQTPTVSKVDTTLELKKGACYHYGQTDHFLNRCPSAPEC